MVKVTTVITKVAKNKKVIKTEKDPDNWWILSEAVEKFTARDNSPVQAGATADIEYEEDNNGDVQVSRINVAKSDKPAESTKKDDYKESSNSRDPVGASIERQCALKSAANIASANFDVNNAEITAEAVVLMAKKFAKFIANKE